MQCIILAGGLATRMKPITEKIPKALIPINGRPFVDYQIQKLKSENIKDIVFAIGFKGEMLKAHLGDGKNLGIQIRYSDEGENLLGTAGAVAKACRQGLMAEEFFIMYGDSFLPINYSLMMDSFRKNKSSVMMSVYENKEKFDQSNCVVRDGKVVHYEKNLKVKPHEMRYIDYGLSISKQTVFIQNVAEGEKKDLSEILKPFSFANQLSAYEVKERFYEIGSMHGLKDFEEYARNNLNYLFLESR